MEMKKINGNSFIPTAEGFPTRFVLGIMLFWGALTAFSLRSCLSLSIVTMVGKRPGSRNSTLNGTMSNGCQIEPDFSNLTLFPDLSPNTTDFFFNPENSTNEVKTQF
jgi:hypothetical protein